VTLARFLLLGKALGDRTRVRALLALDGRELCLCHLVCLLKLAPSTLSKHMTVLAHAGLVERRKAGRWQYFSLPGPDSSPEVRRTLRATLRLLAEDPVIRADRRDLARLAEADPETLAACYRN